MLRPQHKHTILLIQYARANVNSLKTLINILASFLLFYYSISRFCLKILRRRQALNYKTVYLMRSCTELIGRISELSVLSLSTSEEQSDLPFPKTSGNEWWWGVEKARRKALFSISFSCQRIDMIIINVPIKEKKSMHSYYEITIL